MIAATTLTLWETSSSVFVGADFDVPAYIKSNQYVAECLDMLKR